MADFKTALKSLADGELSIDVLDKQLAKLLQKSPHYAKRLLSMLEDSFTNQQISDDHYALLKTRINQFRRKHATETEDASGLKGDSTVFAIEDLSTPPETFNGPPDNSRDDSSPDYSGDNDSSDINISDVSSLESSAPEHTSGTDASASGWSNPSSNNAPAKSDMGPGSIIKQRFKLLEVLGVGGMGKVYKGVDLLKEEARDKNPYVAIKLLNDDFRDHPEAFISLQRESSRQQKLAHPNIATVYDFDRLGGPGTPVYITMELMEGIPLNEYIKKEIRKKGGMPFEQAFDIIKQLGSALSYAHDRGLVHSDFKPGNAFLCKDGTVKTLDFGIARAVKNPVTGEAEKTLFDPGKLGALTPAYASLEMLEGEEPDTRDDTYALACVAYELLAGKHPFNKLPANKAKENNLLPPPIKGLKKKQNRALRRALAFDRKNRSQTVDQFIEELEAKYVWYKDPLTVAAVIIITLGIGATGPVLNYYHKQEIQQIIFDIKNAGDGDTVVAYLQEIKTLDKADQLTITTEAKDSIQWYFASEIRRLIDTSKEDYNFIQASALLGRIAELYPESSYLLEQTELVNKNKKLKLAQLGEEFSTILKDSGQIEKTKVILETIRERIDPGHPLLADERPSYQFRILADQAFEMGNYEQALSLVESGLAVAPEDQQLKDTQDKVQRTIKIAGLEQKLSSQQLQLVSIRDYKDVENALIELASLDTGNLLLHELSASFKKVIQPEILSMLASGDRAVAEEMVRQYGELLSALQLGPELTQIKLAHLEGAERQKAIEKIVSDNNASISELLDSPQLEDDAWKARLLANIQEIDTLAEESAEITRDLANTRVKIANLFIQKAENTLTENRFDAAENLIDSAERYAPGMGTIQTTRQSIATARAEHDKQLRVDGLKKDFNAQVEANKVVKAIEYLDDLKTLLPATDRFITTDAPAALATSYGTLAKSRFAAKDYSNALRLINEGLKYNPNDPLLAASRREYRVEANIQELSNIFNTSLSFNTEDVLTKFGEIESVAPGRYSEFRRESIDLLTKRINELRTTDQNAAASLAQNAAAIFRGTTLETLRDQIRPQPWPAGESALATLASGKLTDATTIQQQQTELGFSGHPEFIKFSNELSARKSEAEIAYQRYIETKEQAGEDVQKLKEARRALVQAQAFWSDNPKFADAESEINKLIAAHTKTAIIPRENPDLSRVATATDSTTPGETPSQKKWLPTPSGRECNSTLAGYGNRAKAICYDLVNDGWRGPLMVVVPGGGEIARPFAIGKYEISIGDYSKYCALSGKCKPVTDKDKFDDPLTGISLKEAENYAKWLSERTGKSYRIPNKKEWLYAANANGQQPRKDFNCRVALGDKIIKGTGTVSVVSGQQNGWGLKNYIGNVQEWVIDGSSIKAVGGAFEDAFSNCDTNLERAHNGGADKTTGFRLVQDDIS